MNHTDEMEGHKRKMMMVLVAEVNRMNEENQNLNSMLNRLISKHQDLEKHIRSLLQEKQQLMGVDPIQIFNPHHKIEDNFNSRIISPRSAEIDSNGDSVSRQSYHSSDCRERVQEMEGKNPKVMDDMQLPSKKRKINYVQLDQIQNRTMDSSMDDTLICDESPNMRHIALSKGSREQQMVAAPKRIVSMRTTTEASVISDGCQWRKYGQKMTRNNPRPRSYYKCAMAPSCTVKRQVQRCAEDPTVVVATYDGEHTHSLSPLAMAVMQAGSSNGKGLDIANSVANNKLMPFPAGIARISTSSSFPTITLDLTDNQSHQGLKVKSSNPGLYTKQHLKAGNSQHLTPLSNSMGHVLDLNQLDHSSIMDSVSSIKADPNFTAALAVAIAGSVLRMGAPIEGMPKHPPVKQNTEGSTMEACM